MVRDDQEAEDVGKEVREEVFGEGAVCGCETDWCGEFVVLFVEACVEGGRVEEAVDVVEAELGAENVEGDGEEGCGD